MNFNDLLNEYIEKIACSAKELAEQFRSASGRNFSMALARSGQAVVSESTWRYNPLLLRVRLQMCSVRGLRFRFRRTPVS